MKKILSILLLASFILTSCGQVTPTLQPPPVVPTVSQMPRLVGQLPVAGERLLLDSALDLIFDREMDSASADSAFALTDSNGDPVAGTISWPDARTLRFTPDDLLAPASIYVASVSASAKSADSVALAEGVRAEFVTVESLTVGQVFPAPDTAEVDLDSTITVIFNRPIVPVTIAEEQKDLPQPLTIQPEVAGTGQWVSSSVYVFQPEKGLSSGTPYLVSVDAGLSDTLGMSLGESYVWKFATRAPGIAFFSLVNGETNPPMDIENVRLDQGFLVNFLQPMDKASTEAAVNLTNRESGKPFPVKFKWADNDTSLIVTPEGFYGLSSYYQFEIAKTALAEDGSPLADGLAFRFSTLPLPRILSVTPVPNSTQEYYDAWATIQFSSPMDFDTLKNRIQISPAPKEEARFYYNEYDWTLNIIGLEPSTDYIVRTLPGMADNYGNAISSGYSWEFATGKKYPSAYLAIPQSLIYRVGGDQSFFFEYTNLDSAEILLYSVTSDEFIRFQRGDIQSENFAPKGRAIRTWKPDLDVPLNDSQIAEYELQDAAGKPLAPGYYFIGVKAEPFKSTTNFLQGAVVIIATDNITFKATESESLVWLTDLETGAPVNNVKVIFYDMDGKQLGTATTNRDGLAYAEDLDEPYYVRTESKDRLAFAAQHWGSGVSAGDFGINQDYWTSPNQPFAFVYTERPIYRPNQDVFIKGIVRQNDDLHYSLPKQDSVWVTIGFEGETLYEQEVALNKMGTFALAYKLGEEVSLGTYDVTVRFEKADETSFAYHSFRVAEYRKPEFEVNAVPNLTDVLAGDPYTLAVDATYYSGGFVGGADVDWFLSASSSTFTPAREFSNFSFSDFDFDRPESFAPTTTLDEGKDKLDSNGHLEISQTATLGKHTNGSEVRFSANVTDVSGNLVSGSTSVHVHPSLIYAGIRSQSYVGVENLPSVFELVVLDWESSPIANQKLTVDIVRREWYSVQEKDAQDTLRWVTTVKDVPVETELEVTTDKDGRAQVSFTPKQGGVYKAIVHVEDEEGNQQKSSQFIWVAGREYIPWQQTNDRTFQLVKDKDFYSVGDTAKLLIAQPFEGEHYALVTYERGHIYKQEVIKLDGNSTIYELPITKDMAPVAYVSVVVIKGADEESGPDFKVGMARLDVDLRQQELSVSIEADKESAGPRDKVTYTVTVKDYAGKPVQAEVSLALVDKAVLALAPTNTPPILSAFYPERALSVITSLGIVLSADNFNENYREAAALGEGAGSGGGKGGGEFGVMTVRQDFRDTAFYEAQVETDKNGKAKVTVMLPENLTTWQMKARAVTKDSLVGEEIHEIVSSKPLLVNAQAPRFFIVEDSARVGASVHNNTKEPLTVKVKLEAEGVELQSDVEQTVEVGAGQQEYVTWDVKVKSGATRVDLTVSAEGGKYSDAAKPAVGTLDAQGIPVYTFHVEETVGTSGVLRDASSVTEAIAMPASIPYKSATVNVELSPSLAASMVDGLQALDDFEYLCMEQTVSRILPNLAALRALELAGQPSKELRDKLDKQVNTALQRIYAKQIYDGGWNWWDGQESDPQTTAYVLLGLVEARTTGYAIDEDVYGNAIGYLLEHMPRLDRNDAQWQYNRQAFIVYVLTRAGELPYTPANFLYENRSHLGNYGKAYLAQAFFKDDPKSTRVKTLMSDLTSAAVLSASGAHWEEAETDYWNWNTDLRSTAIVLDAFVRINPEAAHTTDAVRWLMAHRRSDGWGSTQDTAWTLLALTDWLTYSKEFESSYSYAVGLNGDALAQGQVGAENLTSPVNVEITDEQLSEQVNYLVIARGAGTGNLYYTAYLNAELSVKDVKSLDRGIIVSRQYFTLDDAKKPISEIARGELVRVRVTIVAPAALHYVVVNDPLPAGLEAVDSSLLTDVQVPPTYTVTDFARKGWGWWYFTHTELRDEKVVLSADYLPAGTYVFTYLARAGTAGTFNVIPTTAYEFYFPDVYGRGDGTVFVVKP
ncbi:MAG: hypothetical protein C4583_10305 [Anaerolineaceae bacterium]|nr:MAG: hypothetical protein C4583_10305 [Anaerolineaceae bacterium]